MNLPPLRQPDPEKHTEPNRWDGLFNFIVIYVLKAHVRNRGS